MNIRLCSIENEYDCYDKKKLPEFEELALETEAIMQMLVLGLGNGLFVELKIEVFSLDDYDVVKKLYCNVSNSIKVQPNSELKKNIWLYEDGYEVYKQGKDSYLLLKHAV